MICRKKRSEKVFFELVEVGLQVGPEIVPVHKNIDRHSEQQEKKNQPGISHGFLETLPTAPKVSFSAFVPHFTFFAKVRFFPY